MSRNQFRLEGMDELLRTIRQVGNLPQKTVTKAARSGMRIAWNSARQHAPVDTGNLRRGMIFKGERSRIKGKKVFKVTFSNAMNNIFVKSYGPNNDLRAYYPSSQEYGFTVNGNYTPGYAFLKKSMRSNKQAIEDKIINTFIVEFNKIR